MTDAGGSSPEDVNQESFFDNVLKPGSSFHPTFLLILDGVFAFLLVILLALAFMTSGNIHLIFLTVIELGLWASVKWSDFLESFVL
jgi:ER protein Pkr1